MRDSQWHKFELEQGYLIGALDRETVPHLWKLLQDWQPNQNRYEISLAQVKRVDSAGMVMLIHLIEHAKSLNCHIILSFVPQQLRTLFQLSNIESMMAQHIQSSAGVNGG